MSRFFEALEQAERARKGQVSRPSPYDRESADSSQKAVNVGSQVSDSRSAHAERAVTARSGDSHFRSETLDMSRIDQRLVSLVAPTAFESDQYRTLRQLIETKRRVANIHVLAITSPSPGDGKTLTSINLAGSLAQASDARVLLIDGDLRGPSIGRGLGIHNGSVKGIVDAVLDRNISFDDIVTSYPAFNLCVICAGPPPSPPYEVLKDPRLGEIVEEARARFDFILIDTPPMVPFSDCRLIGKWADGFLVVVSAHKTPKDQLEEGMGTLELHKITGIVFNSDDALAPSRYKYYHRYENKGRSRSWNPFRKRGP